MLTEEIYMLKHKVTLLTQTFTVILKGCCLHLHILPVLLKQQYFYFKSEHFLKLFPDYFVQFSVCLVRVNKYHKYFSQYQINLSAHCAKNLHKIIQHEEW